MTLLRTLAAFAAIDFLTSFLGLSSSVLAQTPSFAIPDSWIHTNITGWNPSQRALLARGLIDTTLQSAPYNPELGMLDSFTAEGNSNILSAIALMDHINGSTNYESMVVDSINKITNSNVTSAIQPWYGLTAVDAYRAYGNSSSLQAAEVLWSLSYESVILPEDASLGTHPIKTMPIASTCNNATMAGGVFSRYGSGNATYMLIQGFTTASFAGLSAYLHELTGNATYQSAAELSLNFLHSQLYKGTIVREIINATDCTMDPSTVSYNTGFTIEALSVQAAVNSTWTSWLQLLVSSSLRFDFWTDSDGINIEYSGSTDPWQLNSRAYLFRGLYTAWNRTDPASGMSQFIAAYMNTQFNSLQTSATIQDTNLYNDKFRGPPPVSFLPTGQINAAYVLNAAFAFNAVNRSSVTTLPSSSQKASVMTQYTSPISTGVSGHAVHKVPAGAVAGGVIGSIVLIILIAAVATISRKYWKKRTEQAAYKQMELKPIPYENPAMIGQVDSFAGASIPLAVSTGVSQKTAAFVQYPTTLEHMNGASRSATAAATDRSGPSSQVDPSLVPGIISRLENIMARLPGGVDEAPPEYEARH